MSVDHYKAVALKQLDALDAKLESYDYVRLASDQVRARVPQARASYLALGVGVFAILFLVWGFGARFVTNLVGFAYPLYQSFNSLKDNVADEKDSQWRTDTFTSYILEHTTTRCIRMEKRLPMCRHVYDIGSLPFSLCRFTRSDLFMCICVCCGV